MSYLGRLAALAASPSPPVAHAPTGPGDVELPAGSTPASFIEVHDTVEAAFAPAGDRPIPRGPGAPGPWDVSRSADRTTSAATAEVAGSVAPDTAVKTGRHEEVGHPRPEPNGSSVTARPSADLSTAPRIDPEATLPIRETKRRGQEPAESDQPPSAPDDPLARFATGLRTVRHWMAAPAPSVIDDPADAVRALAPTLARPRAPGAPETDRPDLRAVAPSEPRHRPPAEPREETVEISIGTVHVTVEEPPPARPVPAPRPTAHRSDTPRSSGLARYHQREW